MYFKKENQVFDSLHTFIIAFIIHFICPKQPLHSTLQAVLPQADQSDKYHDKITTSHILQKSLLIFSRNLIQMSAFLFFIQNPKCVDCSNSACESPICREVRTHFKATATYQTACRLVSRFMCPRTHISFTFKPKVQFFKFSNRFDRSTIKSLTSGNLLKGSKMIVEPFNVCRNVEHANLGRSLISMAQAPHFRTIQLHSQLMGVTIFPELSFKGVLLFNSFRTVATELFLLPSYSNSCQ